MKKFLRLTRLFVCLCAVLTSTSAFAGADWFGNSYIVINSTWCNASTFNGQTLNLGSIPSLSIGGQIQIHGTGDENWGSGSGDWLNYVIDENEAGQVSGKINLSYVGYGYGGYGRDMLFQSGGSTFTAKNIDISSLSYGSHTLKFWFEAIDGKYENGQSSATYYSANFTINISAATVTGVDASYDWTGDVIHPVPVVKIGGTELSSTTDYNVAYSEGCTNAGNYSVTITGKGNYTGTKVVNYTINPGYYVAGIGGIWAINPNYQLFRTDEPEKNEYWINDVVMRSSDAIKIVSSDDGATIKDYFGGSSNHNIQADGSYKIYFRPGQNNDWSDDDGKYFYVDRLTSVDVPLAPIGYGTYYNSVCGVTLQPGAKAYILKDDAPTYEMIADGDDSNKNTVPANTAMMLYSASSPVSLTLSTSISGTVTGNKLHGSDVETTTTGGLTFYKLTYGSSDEHKNDFGWFYGAESGAAFTSPAHKAWLALSAGARGFLDLPDDDTSGIATIENKQHKADNAWYDLNGRRVNAPTTKGIYIKDGRKLVIK